MRARWISLSLLVGLFCGIAVWVSLRKTHSPESPLQAHDTIAYPTPVEKVAPRPAIQPDLSTGIDRCSAVRGVLRTTRGTIQFCFFPKDAPQTVNRLIELIQSGFYNGLKFHRVLPNILVQTGDPEGTGFGGTGKKLKAEFNRHAHNEGTMGMARARDPDSADSQFYITLSPQPALDRDYTVFGTVVEGFSVLKEITKDDRVIEIYLENPEKRLPSPPAPSPTTTARAAPTANSSLKPSHPEE